MTGRSRQFWKRSLTCSFRGTFNLDSSVFRDRTTHQYRSTGGSRIRVIGGGFRKWTPLRFASALPSHCRQVEGVDYVMMESFRGIVL